MEEAIQNIIEEICDNVLLDKINIDDQDIIHKTSLNFQKVSDMVNIKHGNNIINIVYSNVNNEKYITIKFLGKNFKLYVEYDTWFMTCPIGNIPYPGTLDCFSYTEHICTVLCSCVSYALD
jgi:hypothetical protein